MKQLNILKNLHGCLISFKNREDQVSVNSLICTPSFAWSNYYNIDKNIIFIKFYKHTAPLHIEYSLKEILYETT